MAKFSYKDVSGAEQIIAGVPNLTQTERDNIAAVPNKASQADLTSEVTNRTTADAALTTSIAGKLNKSNTFQVATYRALAGATDDSAIDAAIAAAVAANGGVVDFGRSVTYTLTAPHDFPVGIVGYVGHGVTLNCAAVTSSTHGFAIRFIPGPTDATIYIYFVEGLRILGPLSEANNLDGVYLGRPSSIAAYNVAGVGFHNITVRGFRDNWYFGDQSWLNGFFQCSSSKAWRYGINCNADVNAGENYNWHGGVIADCTNSSGTGVGFYAALAGAADCNFYGTSFDYCNKLIEAHSGSIALFGGHLEDRNAGPMITLDSTSNYEPTSVDLYGVVLTGTETVSPGTLPNGRLSFITVAGDRSMVRVKGGRWARFGNADSELVTVTSGSPQVVVEDLDPVTQSNFVPRISGYTSRISNGNFESGLGDWKLASTVNFIRNNAFIAGVAGSPGTRPTNWVANNTQDGLTMAISAIDYSGERPSITVRLSGTPTATGSYSLFFDKNGVTTPPAAIGQTWTLSFNVRGLGPQTGINNVQPAIREKDNSGSTLSASTNDIGVSITSYRRKFLVTKTFISSTAAFVEAPVVFSYTSGVAVDASYIFDMPMLTLEGDPRNELVTTPGQPFATPRNAIDSVVYRGGSKSLSITNTGTGNYGLYRLTTIRPGQRLLVRGYVDTSTATAGTAGFLIDWLNPEGSVVGSVVVGGSYLSSGTAFAQRGGVNPAPVGASTARVWCYTTALNGKANFDDVEVWTI